MLSYKDSQSGKLPYDLYPDNAIDQIVDFSKKYTENESEEVCCSSAKNAKLSLNSITPEENKQTDDEVKVFCVEGTPGMASYASSYCDLRLVGITEPSSEALIPEEQARNGCFSSTSDFSVGALITKNSCLGSNSVVDEDKRESYNEEEQITSEAGFTKSSSPLMFSRTSSVGSLNSFEQHSIVDDRSSVSAFSNLASGLISPSEIPDSPCGVESPFISKSKNTEFVFPTNDKTIDPVLADQTILNEEFEDEDLDGVKVYNYEGDCGSVSNLSALSIQANSIHDSISFTKINNDLANLAKTSSVMVNCSMADKANFIEDIQHSKISDESYIPQLSFTPIKSDLSLDVKDSQTEKLQSKTKYEDKGTSTSEDFAILDPSYKFTMPSLKNMDRLISLPTQIQQQWLEKLYFQHQNEDTQLKDCSASAQLQRIVKEFKDLMTIKGHNIDTYLIQDQPSNYSKVHNDDESGILEEGVLNGKSGIDGSVLSNSKLTLNPSFQTSGSCFKDGMPNCSLSDNDVSGEEDDEEILNECVLLGMPRNSDNVQTKTEQSSVHKVPLQKHINQDPNKSVNLVVPEAVSDLRSYAKEEFPSFDLTSHSNEQSNSKDFARSDDSDADDGDLLLQQCIQLGKTQFRNQKPFAKSKPHATPTFDKPLGSRDNWPDGVSDGDDDDDDMLNELIKAGKPASKSGSSYAGSKPYSKYQNQRKLTAAEDRALYLNKEFFGNMPKEMVQTACASAANSLIGVDDSMYVFRTEDTPLLSPTASLSDLSTLSFTEDKICQESFLNNSRNSDCSTESEDDEMLLQCIRQGRPGGRRVAT